MRLPCSLPSEPSAPGGRPEHACRLRPAARPLGGADDRFEAGQRLPDDRIAVRGRASPPAGGELGPPGALGVPVVRRHQLVGSPPAPRAPPVRRPDRASIRGGRRSSRRSWASVVERHPPSLAGRADDVGVGHPRVGEEHLVERGVPVHLAHRAHLDAGLAHVDREVREAAVLRGVPVGAGDEQAVVGVVGAGVPQLLPVDDPLVAVAVGPWSRARRGPSRSPAR